MADEERQSKGGSTIIRHEERERSWEPPGFEESVAEEVERHFAGVGLEGDSVFHEIASDMIHVDVHICEPSDERPFYTLYTTGMADRAMSTPDGMEEFSRAELMLCLPANWPLEERLIDEEENYWPIRILKYFARFPHEYETWLAFGHSIPNGDPPEPFAESTKLCGVVLASPATIPESAHRFESSQGVVQIYSLLPVYQEEMNLKLEKGIEYLLDRFDAKGVNELIDPSRQRATRKKLFGIF